MDRGFALLYHRGTRHVRRLHLRISSRTSEPCAEENAYTAIKEFAENIPSNGPPRFCDYKLRTAYLDGTTNRLDLAEAARSYLAAESNTIVAAERILAAKGIDTPLTEELSANAHFCTLMRIANIYKVKATYEAAQGDLAADGLAYIRS